MGLVLILQLILMSLKKGWPGYLGKKGLNMKNNGAREDALKIIHQINEKNAYPGIAVNEYVNRFKPDERERIFVSELVYGSVRWKKRIDYIIKSFSKIRINKISPWIMNILRLGIYQIIFMDRVPESASCNESVKLAKKYGHSASSGYVNAVLRNVVRNISNMEYPDRENSPLEYFSIMYSHPEWLVKRYMELYGNDFTEKLLCANNENPPFTIRTNILKTTPDKLLGILRKSGFNCKPGNYAKEAVIVDNPAGIFETDIYREGLFQVQDESSMFAVKMLDPRQGEYIIDVCAAPGGKATYTAELMKNKGRIMAWDIHTHRLRLISNTSKRLGISIVETMQEDAMEINLNYIGKADRVMIDAPCSGLGTIRRRPDIKWSRQEKDIVQLARLQYKILDSSSQYLKNGGVLVYSTCTTEPEENEMIIQRFIDKHKDFALCELKDEPLLMKNTIKKGNMVLFPHIHGTDGFFAAKLFKKG